MEMEAIRSLVTSVPREGAASAAPGGLEGISLAKSGVPIDHLPLFPSPSWQEQEAAGLVRSFLPHCCQGTGAPQPAWLQVCSVQDGSSFGGVFVPLLLFSLLPPPPQDVATISCYRKVSVFWFISCQFLKELVLQAAPVATKAEAGSQRREMDRCHQPSGLPARMPEGSEGPKGAYEAEKLAAHCEAGGS